MPNPTDRLRRPRPHVARHRLVVGACVGSILLVLACDPDGRTRDGDSSPDGRLAEVEEALGPALSQAAAYVKNESNWVEGDGETPNDGGDAADGQAGDGGNDSGGGASCAGTCGAAAADGSCYCDAECTSNGDCCSDYAQHCGGGDGGEGGGNDDGGGDGGGAAGSCAGACGGIGSGGACYCDDACSGSGDCCSDYAQHCGGNAGGDGGGAPTCNGYCGGVGSDGACYCDDACTESGDCCSDYASWCGAGIQIDASFGFTSPLPSMESGSACWGVITDPIDVERIAAAAAVGGAAFGGTCVAVLVVPAGAAAVPSGGISVGATALACGTTALGGAAGGAVAELTSQKMGSIAQCSADILAKVMQIFPWGVGEKVDVPVFTATPADPGNCTPDDKDALQQQVNDVCKNAGTRSCSFADSCATINVKIDTAAQCIDARQKINSQCYDGGDAGHNTAVQQEVNLQNNCWSISSSVGC